MSAHIVPFCELSHAIHYEDEDMLIVSKPSGLLSVPGRLAENKDSLINRVKLTHPSAQIVHRLDCDTSGLMIIALNKTAHRSLSQLFSERQIRKVYHAVVKGVPEPGQGSIELPLICDWPNRPRQKVCFSEGKPSLTHYKLLSSAKNEEQSLIQLNPHTGRSHQLRVHMAELGHPILGDEFYADEKSFHLAKRLQLHACELSFSHPITKKNLHFVSSEGFNLQDHGYAFY